MKLQFRKQKSFSFDDFDIIYLWAINLFYVVVTRESVTRLGRPDHDIGRKAFPRKLQGKCIYVLAVTASLVSILSVQLEG